MCALFSPEILQAWAVKGLKMQNIAIAGSFTLIFFQSSPIFSAALVLVTAVAHVGPQNKVGHPARISHKRFKQVTLVSAYGHRNVCFWTS